MSERPALWWFKEPRSIAINVAHIISIEPKRTYFPGEPGADDDLSYCTITIQSPAGAREVTVQADFQDLMKQWQGKQWEGA